MEKGKAKAIGVSNFSQAEMERLIKETSVVPAAHQIELHPWLQQAGFQEWHDKNGIHVTQYSPFGNQNPIYSKGENLGKLIDDPTLNETGKKYGKSGAQVALAWGVAHGYVVFSCSLVAYSRADKGIDDRCFQRARRKAESRTISRVTSNWTLKT